MNVGGTRYSAFKSTLLSIEGSYFSAMLSSDRWKPDDKGNDGDDAYTKGEYFINRDSTHFHRILNYLRSGTLSVDGMAIYEIKDLRTELDYYQIPDPSEVLIINSANGLRWSYNQKSDNFIISENGKSIQKTGSALWDAGAIGTSSVSSFSIKITKTSNSYIMIGMAPDNGRANEFKCARGYYLFLGSGGLYSRAGDLNRLYTSTVKQNSIVTVHWSKENKTISFIIDGQDRGIAFEKIPADMILYPSIGIHDVPGCVEILD